MHICVDLIANVCPLKMLKIIVFGHLFMDRFYLIG